MQVEIDVFVGNNTLIDPEIYELWLCGQNVQDAVNQLLYRRLKCGTSEMLMSNIQDQYRLYQLLERFLYQPTKLCEQWMFQVSTSTKKMLIERYYEFDCSVIREFLGKKLTSRHRKDLDEVSEKTGIAIKSCRRQFDNVKRVFKAVEDSSGNLVQIIENLFLLSENLSRQYAAIAYITNNRFETGKRKLQYLTFDDFVHCAYQMMQNWSCTKLGCKYEETAMEIDREFLQILRDAKLLLDREIYDEHKVQVLNSLKLKLPNHCLPDLETNFKIVSRTLITIANGLNHNKEVKDLFLDIVEKVIEPLKHSRWSDKDIQVFLEVYANVVSQTETFQNDTLLLQVWGRYITTMSSCILKMYHS